MPPVRQEIKITDLRVLVKGNDSEGWIAQGLEIDYFACAKTEESVKRNFTEGLMATISLYLDEDGNLEGLLHPAPKQVWDEYYQTFSTNRKMLSLEIEILLGREDRQESMDFPEDLTFITTPALRVAI